MSEQSLSGSSRSDQQNVAFRNFNLFLFAPAAFHEIDALVVIVDGDRERLFGLFLPNYVIIQKRFNIDRLRHAQLNLGAFLALALFGDNVVAELNALIANINARSSDQFLDLFLALTAEAAAEGAVIVLLLFISDLSS